MELVAVWLHLMSPHNGEHLFASENFFGRSETEDNGNVSDFVHGKIFRLGVLDLVEWVSPQDVGQNAVLRWFTKAINFVDRLGVSDTLRDTAVEAKKFAIGDRRNRQRLKKLDELLVQFNVKSVQNLSSEVELLRHLFGLVVSS